MIKLGKLTDYAVVVMAQLAKEGREAPYSAGYLSGQTGIPEPTVAKVLKQLSKFKMVESVRGAAGGYKLAKSPADISAADIITAMDGPISIVACAETTGQVSRCRSKDLCPIRGSWTRPNEMIRQALESVKLSEMIAPTCGPSCGCTPSSDGRTTCGNCE